MNALRFGVLTAFLASVYSGGVAAITGMPRTGKTTEATLALPSVSVRSMAFSPYHLRDAREAERGKLVRLYPGRVVTPEELCADPTILDVTPLRLVVCPWRDEGDLKLGRQFAAVLKVAWETGDVDVWADECSRYMRGAVEQVNQIATGGGHAGMRLFAVSQTPGRFPIDFRKMISHWATFALGSPEDLDAVRDRAGRDFADRVARLAGPPHPSPPLTWRLGASSSESIS